MKDVTSGKSLSKRRVVTFGPEDSVKDIREHIEREGTPTGDGRFTIGVSFSEQVSRYRKGAELYLQEKELPYSAQVFQFTDKPKKYIDSHEPEDVERAQLNHHLACGLDPEKEKEPIPEIGKRLDPDLQISWGMKLPSEDHFLSSYSLVSYMQKVGGFAHDALETLAAEIIECCERIQKFEGERALSAAMKLGQTVTLFRHYYRSGKSQKSNATKSRSDVKPLIAKLARQEGSAKELWPKLFALMEEKGMSPVECPLTGAYLYSGEKGDDRTLVLKSFQNQLSIERGKSQ